MMVNYRTDLKKKERDLKNQYNNLIDELEENPSIELSKECSDKYSELFTVRSRIKNLDKKTLLDTNIKEFNH